MKNDSTAIVRAVLLALIVAAAASLCIGENESKNGTTEAAEPPAQVLTCVEAENQTEEEKAPETRPEPASTGEWTSLGTFTLTAYDPCETCCGYWATIRPLDANGNPIVYTASGAIAKEGTTVAVDPTVIPYGSTIKINGHTYIAQDTGGAVRGNRIDIYHADHEAAVIFGRQQAEVFILNETTNTP